MSNWPKTSQQSLHPYRQILKKWYSCLQCLYPSSAFTITSANTPLMPSLSDKSLCFQMEAVSLQATWKDDVRMSLFKMIFVMLRFLYVCGSQAQCEHAQVSVSHNNGCLLRLMSDKQTGWTRSWTVFPEARLSLQDSTESLSLKQSLPDLHLTCWTGASYNSFSLAFMVRWMCVPKLILTLNSRMGPYLEHGLHRSRLLRALNEPSKIKGAPQIQWWVSV